MSKELEALEKVYYGSQGYGVCDENYKIVKEALQRLEAIDNTNPSEAMKSLDRLEYYHTTSVHDLGCKEHRLEDINNIKQYILKSQEQEKENARNEEILQKYYQEGITLDSVRVLKQERDKYKEVLKVIFKKNVDIWLLKSCLTVEQYNFSITKIDNCDVFNLTKEDFELLKRYIKKNEGE